MSTFYILPARPVLGDHVADCFAKLLPGVVWDCHARRHLADTLIDSLVIRPDVYLVAKDDLPADEAVETVLIDGYGASPGDEIVELHPGLQGEFFTRRWSIGLSRAA
jgi:hypothetical protein